jgi:hypothetical protein
MTTGSGVSVAGRNTVGIDVDRGVFVGFGVRVGPIVRVGNSVRVGPSVQVGAFVTRRVAVAVLVVVLVGVFVLVDVAVRVNVAGMGVYVNSAVAVGGISIVTPTFFGASGVHVGAGAAAGAPQAIKRTISKTSFIPRSMSWTLSPPLLKSARGACTIQSEQCEQLPNHPHDRIDVADDPLALPAEDATNDGSGGAALHETQLSAESNVLFQGLIEFVWFRRHCVSQLCQ